MNDDDFEWDEAKADANYEKHGVSFETAREAFSDPFGIERRDLGRHGEERFLLTGVAEGTIIVVVYTERDGRIRIISARQATKGERNDYYQQNT